MRITLSLTEQTILTPFVAVIVRTVAVYINGQLIASESRAEIIFF